MVGMEFWVGGSPLWRWGSGGAPRRCGRLVRARRSVDLLCVFFPHRIPWCGGSGPVKKKKEWMMVCKAMVSAAQGGGSPEPRPEDFSSAEGLLPIQGQSGVAAAARHRHVLILAGDIVLQMGLSVIFIFVGCLSVISLR